MHLILSQFDLNMGNRISKKTPHIYNNDVVDVRNNARPGNEVGGSRFMRAMCDIEATFEGDLSFRRSELFEIVNCTDELWWQMRHFDSGEVGYVHRQWLQPTDRSAVASLDCWFQVDRLESERLLRMPGREDGTYMMRPHSQQKPNQQSGSVLIVLSVRTAVPESAAKSRHAVAGIAIRHYKILPLDNRSGFYVHPAKTFATLEELLLHYGTPGSDRTLFLRKPCPREFTPPLNFRDFEINRDQLKLMEKIGSGSFGKVNRAMFGPVLEVAVKRMRQGSITANAGFLEEAKLMHRLHHPKIVQLVGVCTQVDPVFIVTEYMSQGSLHSYLARDRTARAITMSDMLNYLQQIADGMSYLESKKYIHSDLRAANILVGGNQVVKVADFGLARLVENGYYMRKSGFPVRWSPPECFERKMFSTKSDVWSFGVVIFEVATRGEKPYKALSETQVEENVRKGKLMPNTLAEHGIEPRAAGQLYECMLDCWSRKRKQRPTFDRLKYLFEDFAIEGEQAYVELVH